MGFVGFDRGPLRPIAASVEPRQDHRAPLERRHRRDQPGHRRDAAGKPGGDDRVARRRPAPLGRLLGEQAVAAVGRVDRTFGGEDAGPSPRQDFEKAADDLPMLGQIGRRQIGEPRKARALGRHRVEKPRQTGGECCGLARQQRVAAAPPAPLQHQPGQQQPAPHFRDRRRHLQAAILDRVLEPDLDSSLDQRQFFRIEVADRPHPRQQQRRSRLAPIGQHAQKGIAQGAHGAPGRQQNGDPRQCQRVAAGAGEQTLGQGREKRPVWRDRVKSGLHRASRP